MNSSAVMPKAESDTHSVDSEKQSRTGKRKRKLSLVLRDAQFVEPGRTAAPKKVDVAL